MKEPDELENHLAREVMQEVTLIMKKERISKRAAYYAFFGFLPEDTSFFSKKEIELIKKYMGYKQVRSFSRSTQNQALPDA